LGTGVLKKMRLTLMNLNVPSFVVHGSDGCGGCGDGCGDDGDDDHAWEDGLDRGLNGDP